VCVNASDQAMLGNAFCIIMTQAQ